jgi:DNA polymerase-3 subunit delta
MTPELAIREAQAGELRPVYLVLGEERLLSDRVIGALRQAATRDGTPGFNEDRFTAGEANIDAVLAAANMIPMLAPRRFVLVRSVERWEAKKGDDEDAKTTRALPPLDRLAEYAKEPNPSTVLVLAATKLHAQRKLVTGAKKGGYAVPCESPHRRDLPHWILAEARARGHEMHGDIGDLLAELVGPELSPVADALDRLSLYVGEGQPITDEAVEAIVTRVRQRTVWELIDAISARDPAKALAAVADVYDPRDGGLRLLGLVSWSVRQLLKFDAGLRAGLDSGAAAQRAGLASFKVRDTQQTLRRMAPGTLERWVHHLAETDLALKGSRRPASAVLETLILDLCRT